MSEFEEMSIKCEYYYSGDEEEMERELFDNNFDTSNLSDDCLDTKIIDKIVPENESDSESISEPSTFNGETLGSRAVRELNTTTRLGQIEEIRQNEQRIEEPIMVNFLLRPGLSFEILYLKPNFDQYSDLRGYTSCTCIGDRNGHFGYSVKYHALINYSIEGSLARATEDLHSIKRLPVITNNKKLYTVPFPVTGVSGNIVVKLIPEFTAKIFMTNFYVMSMLRLAGIDNCVVEIRGCDPFCGNIPLATYNALVNLYDNE